MIETGLFWICCLMAIAGALGAAIVRNLFHAALLLGLCLAGIAGLYLFLQSPYLACVQVVVYIGGILILVLFATLFSADIMGRMQQAPAWLRWTAIAGAGLAAAVGGLIGRLGHDHGIGLAQKRSDPASVADAVGGGAGNLGDLLLGPWLVPFLAAAVLLTLALVGAVATVRRFRRRGAAP